MQRKAEHRKALYGQVERVAIPRGRLAQGVRRLAAQIARHYGDAELEIVGGLYGAMVFLADLIRELPLSIRLHMVGLRSYEGRRAGRHHFYLPLDADLEGKHVLVVDDILDGGRTLAALLRITAARRPASLKSCVLFCKPARGRDRRPQPDFVGFRIGREFVVGYGLDCDGRCRNLSDLCVLKREARSRRSRP